MKGEGAGSRPYYFFDTNAWLPYLVGLDNLQGQRGEFYANLLEDVIYINGITDPQKLKRYKFQPKIIVSSLLLSEIYNAYLRMIAYEGYLKESGLERKDLGQKAYRGTEHFQNHRALMYANIEVAQNAFLFVDDNFNALNPLKLLESIPKSSDFNDFYYYSFLKKIETKDFKVSIITDDGDFAFEDIEIITINHTLRQLSKK